MGPGPHGQPFDHGPGRHPSVEVASSLLAQRGAALDVADVIHDLKGKGELVCVAHQDAKLIVVEAARRATVRTGQPEQRAGLRLGHDFVVSAHGGVVDGRWQGLDELPERQVRDAVEVGDARCLTEPREHRRVVGQHSCEYL